MRRSCLQPQQFRLSGAILLLAGAFASCSLVSPSGRVFYQEGSTVVWLEPDPTVAEAPLPNLNTHPITITPAQLTKLLDSVLIKINEGWLEAFIGSPSSVPVFKEKELALLTPVLSRGLAEAGSSEHIAFTFWSTLPGRHQAPITGFVSVKDPYLVFRLKDHPIVGWQGDPEDPLPSDSFELDFRRAVFLKQGSAEERKGSYKMYPTVEIDYRQYLRAFQELREPTS